MGTRGNIWQAEVLKILMKRAEPLSAYQILDELKAAHEKVAPPTVYRALASLSTQGQVHRLESLNAYIACKCDDHHHASILSICDDCGSVEESVAPDLVAELSSIIGKSGFEPSRHVIEVHGVCGSCGTEPTSA